MAKLHLISISPILLILLLGLSLSASKAMAAESPAQAPSQSSKADAPAAESPEQARRHHHPAPPNVTDVLEKAGGFSTFIKLLKNTQVSNQIDSQLNDTNNRLTILAPPNEAFSSLRPGTLNDLSNEDKVQLLQFHLIPSFESLSNFQTISNPVRTQASNTRDYPLNITTSDSTGSVNISTGVVNTSISGTVYSDNQLAVYRIQKVLLPLAIFGAPISPSPSPAPSPSPLKAPAPSKPKMSSSPAVEKPKKGVPPTAAAAANSSTTTPASVNVAPVAPLDLSGGVGVAVNHVASSVGVAVVAGVYLWSRLL